MLVPKYLIRELCDRYEWVLPNFDVLPEHTRVEIDPGTFRQEVGEVNWVLLEALLFEDMCALLDRKSVV